MNPAATQEAAPPAAVEAGRTTFYVFTASDDLLTFTFVGTQEANDRDQALRKQFGGHPPLSVAVSAHAWKPRKPRVEAVVRGLSDVGMPEPGATITGADPDEAEELGELERGGHMMHADTGADEPIAEELVQP